MKLRKKTCHCEPVLRLVWQSPPIEGDSHASVHLARNDMFLFYILIYCTATQPGPPWVMKAGLRG